MKYKETIIEYIKILKPELEIDSILDFKIEELLDRVYIYINTKNLPKELLRAIAKAFVEEIERTTKTEEELEISSISDNGQTISFRNKSEYKSSNDRIMNDLNELLTHLRKRTVEVVGAYNEFESKT